MAIRQATSQRSRAFEVVQRLELTTLETFVDGHLLFPLFVGRARLLNSAQHSWPVGSLKPNDLGLFDMHGNVWNWCQDSDRAYALVQQGKIMEDNDDLTLVTNAERRMLRGGSFGRQAVNIRSAFALRVLPTYHDNDVGLRPARTLR